jgi:hypothetical protein
MVDALVMMKEVVCVRIDPLAPFPDAVTVQVPAGALVGMVIGSEKVPVELAVTCRVSMLQTLTVTLAPGAYPVPVIVSVPPGATAGLLEVSVPVHVVDPGG